MRYHSLIFAALLSYALPVSGLAENSGKYQIGFVASIDGIDPKDDIDQYELFFNRRLDYIRPLFPESELYLTLTFGVIDSGPDTGYVVTAGPNLFWPIGPPRFWLDVGMRASLLTKHKFSNKNFGQNFQFISHLGVKYNINRNLSIGYRFQHMSNAGMNSSNPGLDLVTFWFTYNY
jgi:hypothetical protein